MAKKPRSKQKDTKKGAERRAEKAAQRAAEAERAAKTAAKRARKALAKAHDAVAEASALAKVAHAASARHLAVLDATLDEVRGRRADVAADDDRGAELEAAEPVAELEPATGALVETEQKADSSTDGRVAELEETLTLASEPPVATGDAIDAKTVVELRRIAGERGITGASRMSKAQLVERLGA